jgi:hypothetical protein
MPSWPVRASRRHVNTRLLATLFRRATVVTLTPGCNVSATIRIFSSFDQRRRRSAPSRTSTRLDLMTLKPDSRSQSPETVVSPQGDLHRMHRFSILCDSVRRTRRF